MTTGHLDIHNYSAQHKSALLNEAQVIVNTDWFRETHSQSKKLTEFYSHYKLLKE